MDNKLRTLVITTILLLMVICMLVIYVLVDKNIKKETENNISAVTPTSSEDLESLPIEDPVGEDGMKVHTSENGYSIKYPSDMTAKSMAKSVDFILEDENSGSSLNIVTAKNDGSVKKFTQEEFETSLSQTSYGAQLLSYEEIVLNGAEAVKAEFIYMENHVKQVVIINDSYAYNITVMKSDYITDEMSEIFDNVVNSFTLN